PRPVPAKADSPVEAAEPAAPEAATTAEPTAPEGSGLERPASAPARPRPRAAGADRPSEATGAGTDARQPSRARADERREAIRRALVAHGYLWFTRRRIPLPIRRKKVPKITGRAHRCLLAPRTPGGIPRLPNLGLIRHLSSQQEGLPAVAGGR